jgi:hypothetical protein
MMHLSNSLQIWVLILLWRLCWLPAAGEGEEEEEEKRHKLGFWWFLEGAYCRTDRVHPVLSTTTGTSVPCHFGYALGGLSVSSCAREACKVGFFRLLATSQSCSNALWEFSSWVLVGFGWVLGDNYGPCVSCNGVVSNEVEMGWERKGIGTEKQEEGRVGEGGSLWFHKRQKLTEVMANSKYEYVKGFEQNDSLLPQTWIVIQVDGRGFTRF